MRGPLPRDHLRGLTPPAPQAKSLLVNEPRPIPASTLWIGFFIVVFVVAQLIGYFRRKIAEEEREHHRAALESMETAAEARKRRDEMVKGFEAEYEASKRAPAPKPAP